ncbi:hypothetical protein [Planctomyces sp. SH-PL14]|uniref:hypothetical protein n=1 Tax=Planctomyces sp. SH-PL14 TaxID=1632864 RepID=UPI00078E2B01|nr:hypothetical protein [Planctomyces sp. SH-PL14]AMV21919.1 hypothetical protein VT03_28715 [Planctomyces sp. SH-PL14]
MEFLQSLWQFIVAGAALILSLLKTIGPWTPLLAWIAFWSLAVDWKKLQKVLLGGGAIGVVLIGLLWMLVWGVVDPPVDGYHYIFGLRLSNFVGKLVYVTMLLVIMYLSGSVQLAGLVDPLGDVLATAWNTDLTPADEHAHGDHGHGDHGHHDHADHGHSASHHDGGHSAHH